MNTTNDIPCFRDLYDQILAYRRWHLYDDVLLPWSDKASSALSNANCFRHQHNAPKDDDLWLESMWNLYALSRVSDELLLPLQASPAHRWERPAVNVDHYVTFFHQMGMTTLDAAPGQSFSPFHHEIFEVENSDDDAEPITIIACIWPGLWFGQMLFSRAGVKVRGGRHFISKQVAETSTLYFAFRRLNRPTSDLSHGWGSNSQWRTSIRRDYQCDNRLFYNLDGSNPLWLEHKEPDRDGLSPEMRLELCRNRCFLRPAKPDGDLWPYDDQWQEDINAPAAPSTKF